MTLYSWRTSSTLTQVTAAPEMELRRGAAHGVAEGGAVSSFQGFDVELTVGVGDLYDIDARGDGLFRGDGGFFHEAVDIQHGGRYLE